MKISVQMKFIFSVPIISFLFLNVIAENGIKEYNSPKDAFECQNSQLPISYRNHSSIVMCKIFLGARHRSGIAHFNLQDISSGISFDGNLCTHVIYQRLTINSQNGKIIRDNEYFFMKWLNGIIQTKYPHLKTLVEIELSSDVNDFYKALLNLLSTRDKQSAMISMFQEIMSELNLSGAYFGNNFFITSPDENFVNFAQMLKREFRKHDLMLVTEVWGRITQAFDQFFSHVTQISRIFDILVLRGWNYGDLYNGRPAHGSPLLASELNELAHIDKILNHLIFKLKVRRSNILLGITFMGQPFLMKPETTSTNMTIETININGPILGYGVWLYFEVCHSVLFKNESWRTFWDEKAKVPFMEDGKRWISFENADSVYEKAIYANKLGLLGVLTDATEADDVNGVCTATKYSLLKSVNIALAKSQNFRESLLCPEFKMYLKNITEDINSDRNWQSDYVMINPYNQSVTAKSTAKINCSVDGAFWQNFIWIKVDKNGKEDIIKSEKDNIHIQQSILTADCLPYQTTISTLEIRNMGAQNVGKYICRAAKGNKTIAEESYLNCKNCIINNEETFQNSQLQWVWITIIAAVTIAIAMGLVKWLLVLKMKLGLTNMEITLFNNGLHQKTHEYNDTSDECANTDDLPYDKDNFEIYDDVYQIDRGSILGAGQFGIVYKGRINDNLVAVKTTKPECDKQYLKSLLQELKVLIHIGSHPNIVSVLGARTKKLSQGVAYIFVEYCALGSLQGFLRKRRKDFVKSDANSYERVKNMISSNCLTTYHLTNWSYQLINALQHLRLRKVIHGDYIYCYLISIL